MAILSNINDKFAVDSTGAIQFSGQAGTSGYVLKSNGNTAPTWVDASTVIGGPYLPLSGGTLTGATATASGISFTVGGTAQFDGDMTLPAAADNFDIGFNLQTTGKIRFGHTSWNNSIGLESYWMVMRSNQNEGYKFIDSAGNTYVQFNASNNASGAYNSTFAGNITVNKTTGVAVADIISGDNYSVLTLQGGQTGDAANGFGIYSGYPSAGDFTIRENGVANYLTIAKTTGNVGIGITSPSSLLHLLGADATVEIQGSGVNSTAGVNFFPRDGSDVAHLQSIKGVSSNLTFLTGGNSGNSYVPTERMRIDSSGNVLINKNAKTNGYPVQFTTLSIKSSSSIESCPIFEMVGRRDANAGNQNAMIQFYNETGTLAEVGRITSDQGSATNSGGLGFMTANAGTLAERMRITSGGNVNIGVYESGSSTITGPFVVTHASTRFMTASYEDSIVSINSKNNSNTLESLRLAGAYVVFYSGSGTTGSERMRITSGGEVLIRRTSSASTSFSLQVGDGTSDSYRPIRCEVASTSTRTQIAFHNPGQTAAVGAIQTYNTSTVYTTGSDYRLKENVVPMKGALDRVDQLKPSRFNFIGYEEIVDGFLAHEVQNIVPEAIIGIKDEVDTEGNPVYQGIDQSKLVPLLVGAIKELKAEIEILKTQINN